MAGSSKLGQGPLLGAIQHGTGGHFSLGRYGFTSCLEWPPALVV